MCATPDPARLPRALDFADRVRPPRHNAAATFRWPAVLAILTVAGLVAGLFDDAWFDVAAWIGLALPLVVAGVAWERTRC